MQNQIPITESATELDWMPPADLRKAMRYLVADLLPVPVDDASLREIANLSGAIGDMAQDPPKVWIGDADGLPEPRPGYLYLLMPVRLPG